MTCALKIFCFPVLVKFLSECRFLSIFRTNMDPFNGRIFFSQVLVGVLWWQNFKNIEVTWFKRKTLSKDWCKTWSNIENCREEKFELSCKHFISWVMCNSNVFSFILLISILVLNINFNISKQLIEYIAIDEFK